MSRKSFTGLIASLALVASAAGAQDAKPKVDPMTVVPDPATVAMPKLDFVSNPLIEADFDKYYFFNRANTSFEEARHIDEILRSDRVARDLKRARDGGESEDE